MGKFKVAVSFDTKLLNSLKDTEKSGVQIQRNKHHLALHPIQLNNFSKSIKELLKEGVAKYSKELNGILLGYQNIKLLSDGGVIHNDSCYIHLDIEADFFVFKPEVGEEMQGVVTRKSKDHVGLLVYNTFNVSIPAPQDQDEWLGKCVNIGYEVLFKIAHFHFTSYLPYIKGELTSILSEVDNKISGEDSDSKKVKKKKKKKLVFDEDLESPELSQEEPKYEYLSEVEDSPKKKKSKKDKLKNANCDDDLSFSELIESESIDNENNSSVIVHKKEKRKKIKVDDSINANSDFDSFLNLTEIEKPKSRKRKKSESEAGDSPKKKKKRESGEM